MAWHSVAKVGAVRANDVIPIAVGALELALGRDGDRYFATQRQCMHQGGDLAEGIVSRGHLVCPHHGWRFSTATGQHETASHTRSAERPIEPFARFCLRTYAVRVVGDDIQIELTGEVPA